MLRFKAAAPAPTRESRRLARDGLDAHGRRPNAVSVQRQSPADAQSSSKASWSRNGRSSAAGDQASADYAFDETDWDTIELGIFDTDDEKPDGWYAYPLVGSSATLEVSLAHSVGSEVMSIRVAGG